MPMEPSHPVGGGRARRGCTTRALLRREDRLESHRVPSKPHHHRDRGDRALSHPARHRRQGGRVRRCCEHRCCKHRAGGAVRCRRLFHADVLRSVRAAHDRADRRSLSGRGARRLHQLFGRPQCGGERAHRRRGALPHLFGLGPRRDRGRQTLLRRGPDLLARQCHRARARHRLCAAGRVRHRPVAGLVQSRRCDRDPDRAGDLCRLGVAQPARHRPRRLAGDAAGRAADAAADRHRHRRSRRSARSPCTCWCRTSRISALSRWR